MALMLKVVIKDRCVLKKWPLLDSHRVLSRIELLHNLCAQILSVFSHMLFNLPSLISKSLVKTLACLKSMSGALFPSTTN